MNALHRHFSSPDHRNRRPETVERAMQLRRQASLLAGPNGLVARRGVLVARTHSAGPDGSSASSVA
jgi:hypothetical protein